ncbi:hypothetical protein [Actinomadura kijaniata]|uniref:hypothetical protein n=1 Tax=Actinomadura kijaniata TaxID=46161 RepID=UPI0008367CB9|nr:hypothetical protein [Actinomadura kijaniata]
MTTEAERQDTTAAYEVRPPRGMLWWALPGLVVSVALALSFLVYDGYGVITMGLAGLVGVLYFGRLCSLLLRGRTVADAKGLVHGRHGSLQLILWKQVKELRTLSTPFGRRVMVVRKGGTAGVVALAAPREGLLGRTPDFDRALADLTARCRGRKVRVQAVKGVGPVGVVGWTLGLLLAVQLVEFPWQETWWPGNKEAGTLPRACRVVDEGTVRGLVPGAVNDDRFHDDGDPFQTSACHWGVAGRKEGLELRLQRYSREGGSGGTANARDRMRTFLLLADSRPVRGVGEQAWQITEPGGAEQAAPDGLRRVQLLGRRHNVVVLVDYTARNRPADEMERAVADLARRALGQVRFG